MLGMVAFASQIPILIFGALGGVWIDRVDRRRLFTVGLVASLVDLRLTLVACGLVALLAAVLHRRWAPMITDGEPAA